MAYTDAKEMSSSRLTSIVIVVLIHVFLGYVLITGLAYDAVKNVVERTQVFDVEEEVPELEELPPPEPVDQPPVEPPPFMPPPIVRTPSPPPTTTTTPVQPDRAPVNPVPQPQAPVAQPPPPPPPPAAPPTPARATGDKTRWVTLDDYPTRALREERVGRTVVRLSIGVDGRVAGCSVVTTSGHSDLDDATCRNATRRGRYNPATRDGVPVEGTDTLAVRWVLES